MSSETSLNRESSKVDMQTYQMLHYTDHAVGFGHQDTTVGTHPLHSPYTANSPIYAQEGRHRLPAFCDDAISTLRYKAGPIDFCTMYNLYM